MAISFPTTSTSGTFLNSSAVTIAKPTSVAANDVLLAMVVSTKSTVPGSFTWPGGWTVLDTQGGAGTGGDIRCEIAWHLVTGGDGSTYSVTADSNATGSSLYICSAYRGCDTTTPVIAHGISSLATGTGAVTAPTQTSSTSGLWRVSFFAGHTVNTAVFTFGSYSPADTQRAATSQNSDTYRPIGATVDSTTTVDASGGTAGAATPSASAGSKMAWTGLIQVPFVPPSTYDSCGVLVAF